MGYFQRTLKRQLSWGISELDSDHVTLQKQLLNLLGVTVPLASFWGFLYLIFGEFIPGIIMIFYTVFGFIGFGLYLQNPERYAVIFLQLRLQVLLWPIILAFSLGNFSQSSFFVIWSFTAPLTSLLVDDGKKTRRWFFAFIVALILFAIVPPIRQGNDLPSDFILFFTVLNIIGMSVPTYFTAEHAIKQRAKLRDLLSLEKEKTEHLLQNVLPQEVIPTLQKEQVYVKEFDDVSVMFADIVGFTELSQEIGPREMLDILNDIFSYFDTLLKDHHAEKIRTVGDNYMVAVGTPVPYEDHAFAIIEMAKRMLAYLDNPRIKAKKINFRIGINSGSAVAGVIGRHKFHFDIWGDMVNTASRLESHGIPGKIQIGESTYDLIKNRIQCENRGKIELKGKGMVQTYIIE